MFEHYSSVGLFLVSTTSSHGQANPLQPPTFYILIPCARISDTHLFFVVHVERALSSVLLSCLSEEYVSDVERYACNMVDEGFSLSVSASSAGLIGTGLGMRLDAIGCGNYERRGLVTTRLIFDYGNRF